MEEMVQIIRKRNMYKQDGDEAVSERGTRGWLATGRGMSEEGGLAGN